MKRLLLLATLLTTLLGAGCASQDDLNRATSDNLRFTARVVGFALDADLESLDARLAILRAFKDDPKIGALEQELGTIAEVEAKRDRIRAAQRALMEESKKLRARYRPEGEQ